MNCQWILFCLLISVSYTSSASVLHHERNVINNEGGSGSGHFIKTRQESCYNKPSEEPNLNLDETRTCDQQHYDYGTCSVQCKAGYTPEDKDAVSPVEIICKDGVWTDSKLNCRPLSGKCGFLEILHAKNFGCPETEVLQKCSVACNDNYELDVEEEIICKADQTWSVPSPTCKLKKCGRLEISHAKNNGCPETEVLQKCSVACNDNYELDVKEEIICQDDKTWSVSSPTCTLTEEKKSRESSGQTATKITNNSCQKCIIVNARK